RKTHFFAFLLVLCLVFFPSLIFFSKNWPLVFVAGENDYITLLLLLSILSSSFSLFFLLFQIFFLFLLFGFLLLFSFENAV
ncbi:hypothetical protein, partial [Treponema pectinovorum]|uniref:hypothetical protein n=1 Tax=Treponema pectinovorum TaxID=164 RepID=UPI001C9C1B9A